MRPAALDMNQVREILFRAKSEKGFVVFGTHSSNPEEFSAQKTEAVLQMAVEMGFRFRRPGYFICSNAAK